MASKKKTKRKKAAGGARGGVNKSAFVRSLPATMPAAEVVSKAKAAGMTINEKYVYNIRAAARAKAGKTGMARRGRPKAAASATRGGASAAAETRLAEIVLELGLARSEQLFETIRERVRRAALG